MIELQLKTFITYRLVGTAEQKDKLLTQYRKAIAEAPSKYYIVLDMAWQI